MRRWHRASRQQSRQNVGIRLSKRIEIQNPDKNPVKVSGFPVGSIRTTRRGQPLTLDKFSIGLTLIRPPVVNREKKSKTKK